MSLLVFAHANSFPAGTYSVLFRQLKARGFQITADPYPEHKFFERSDNYQLALAGIVAHTVSGWATTPTYHKADDDIAHIVSEAVRCHGLLACRASAVTARQHAYTPPLCVEVLQRKPGSEQDDKD